MGIGHSLVSCVHLEAVFRGDGCPSTIRRLDPQDSPIQEVPARDRRGWQQSPLWASSRGCRRDFSGHVFSMRDFSQDTEQH